jgi:hypothetical protein
MSVCCECCVLSGRDLCDELITRPEESYRVCSVIVCELETSWMRPWPTGGCRTKSKQTKKYPMSNWSGASDVQVRSPCLRDFLQVFIPCCWHFPRLPSTFIRTTWHLKETYIERRSTRSRSVENWLCNRLLTCRKTNKRIITSLSGDTVSYRNHNTVVSLFMSPSL